MLESTRWWYPCVQAFRWIHTHVLTRHVREYSTQMNRKHCGHEHPVNVIKGRIALFKLIKTKFTWRGYLMTFSEVYIRNISSCFRSREIKVKNYGRGTYLWHVQRFMVHVFHWYLIMYDVNSLRQKYGQNHIRNKWMKTKSQYQLSSGKYVNFKVFQFKNLKWPPISRFRFDVKSIDLLQQRHVIRNTHVKTKF